MAKKSGAKGRFVAPSEWTFKTPSIAKAFDSHVREQLPWYEIATGAVVHVVRCFLPDGGVILDVGASTGNIGRALAPLITARNASFFAIDNSLEMADVYDAPGKLAVADARDFDFFSVRSDVIVCFLSLMFIPPKNRDMVMQRMKNSLAPGGAIVVVDKIAPRAGYAATVNYRLTLAAKHEAGATAEEIIRKELSISGIQRPMSEAELEGFSEFFRFGDFAGLVWEKS